MQPLKPKGSNFVPYLMREEHKSPVLLLKAKLKTNPISSNILLNLAQSLFRKLYGILLKLWKALLTK